jgi:hypothetical protein
MLRARFWFNSMPEVALSRTDEQFDFQHVVRDGHGWAVLTQIPVVRFEQEADWEFEFTQQQSTPGVLAMVTATRLGEAGVVLPTELTKTVEGGQPAIWFGSGKPGTVKVDSTYLYASRWQFDQYQVIVTIARGLWLCAVAGSHDLLQLRSID